MLVEGIPKMFQHETSASVRTWETLFFNCNGQWSKEGLIKIVDWKSLLGQLDEAKDKVDKYRRGELTNISEDDIWAAKHLVDSAYHPDTGTKVKILYLRVSKNFIHLIPKRLKYF